MKTLFLASALVLVTASSAMADRFAGVGTWDCVINDIGKSKEEAYAYQAQSTVYTTGHDIHFKETLPSSGYVATVEKREGSREHGIEFDVSWGTSENMSVLTVLAEGGYNVMIPQGVDNFAVHLSKPFNYGPEKIVCYKLK